jgi:hypothetical protein
MRIGTETQCDNCKEIIEGNIVMIQIWNRENRQKRQMLEREDWCVECWNLLNRVKR